MHVLIKFAAPKYLKLNKLGIVFSVNYDWIIKTCKKKKIKRKEKKKQRNNMQLGNLLNIDFKKVTINLT